MEPFISIGELLKEEGHQVICAFPEQFRDLAEGSNLEFTSLGTKYIDILNSDEGRAAMGGEGSGFKKLLAFIKLARNQTEVNKELVNKTSCKKKAEQIASRMEKEDFRTDLYNSIVE